MSILAHDMPLAVNTGSFWPASTEESIRLLQEMDLRDIELTLQAREFYLDFQRELRMPLLAGLQQMVELGALRVRSVHAPNMPAEDAHSLQVREEYLALAVRTCRRLGGSVVVVHPFHLFRSYEEALGYLRGAIPDVWDALLPGLRTLLEQAQREDVEIALENVKIWADDETGFFNVPAHVKRFIEDVAHPSLGLTLDIMHAQLAGHLGEFLEALAGSIVNLHIADAIPPGPDVAPPGLRVPPGEGTLDWEELMPACKRLPRLQQLTIELARAEPREVAQAADFVACRWGETQAGLPLFQVPL